MSVLLQNRFADPLAGSRGNLRICAYAAGIGKPVPNAKVRISPRGSGSVTEELTTDVSGQTYLIDMPCPPAEYSMEPNQPKPYSEYDIEVNLDGYETMKVDGVQIMENTTALQSVTLTPTTRAIRPESVRIQDHWLWGDFPPKTPEEEIKPLPPHTGFAALDKPVAPEYVVVHSGRPDNPLAQNYWIPYKDYIKNVASSEIYATWPAAAITANVLAIISRTLNRVFTEWYRGKGHNFTITSSTQFDQKFVYGRNIFQEISVIVDEIFTNYITRPGIRQPLFAQYCDGRRYHSPTWMRQWESVELGVQGHSGLNILRHFYGQDIYMAQTEKVMGVPVSYPGSPLTAGSGGSDVRRIQNQLNVISNNFPAIPKLTVDGIYGAASKSAVQTFQRVFSMPVTGNVDFSTWYRISDIYVGVARMAELVS